MRQRSIRRVDESRVAIGFEGVEGRAPVHERPANETAPLRRADALPPPAPTLRNGDGHSIGDPPRRNDLRLAQSVQLTHQRDLAAQDARESLDRQLEPPVAR